MVPELEQQNKDHEIAVKHVPKSWRRGLMPILSLRKQPCIYQNRERKYPGRERKTPAYIRGYDINFEDDQAMISIHYCYYVVFPKSYKEAMESPDTALWEEAMKEEIESLVENETFTLEVLPEGREAAEEHRVYTTKEGKLV